jgi:hypothetical protein
MMTLDADDTLGRRIARRSPSAVDRAACRRKPPPPSQVIADE